MIVNLIKKNLYPSLLFGGLTSGEVLERTFSPNEIISPHEAVSLGGVTCLLYDDVPLLTNKTLQFLYKKCKKEKVGFKLGRGFIRSDEYVGKEKFFPCAELLPVTMKNYPVLAEKINRKIIDQHQKNGVLFLSTTAHIDFDVKICAGAVIGRNVSIEGKSFIGENAYIGDNSRVVSSEIGEGCRVLSAFICSSSAGAHTSVGPFAYLREGTKVGKNCRVGDFVEIKNSVLFDGVKAAHLCYIGDGEVGKCTNVGCGTVFCNYDGKTKQKVKVGENVFIGANSNLVAPLTVGSHAFLAAGGTITDDVPPHSFVIARTKQTTKKKK